MAEQIAWVFFGLKGRLSPGAYFLAGLLLLLTRAFLFYRAMWAPEGSSEQSNWAIAFVAAVLATAWCNIALTSKRFHDFGRPSAWSLITLLVDFLIFFVLPFVKGDPGPNRYGATTNAPA